ncbi:MAG: hypothetical protein HOO06_14420 [Bdellovibrionaceae bacterium]|jgi:hypothetical protein|nr:hypothetical protein [Pseudobdellovibrionaceae bacterium]
MSKRKIILLAIGIILSLLLVYEFVLYQFLDRDPSYYQIDRCIDSGKCWDGVDKVCRGDEPNAQDLCDRAKVNGKTLEQRIEDKIEKINPDN